MSNLVDLFNQKKSKLLKLSDYLFLFCDYCFESNVGVCAGEKHVSPSSYVSPKINSCVERHVLVKDYMRSCNRTKVFIKHCWLQRKCQMEFTCMALFSSYLINLSIRSVFLLQASFTHSNMPKQFA